jgi:phospholipid/cholesterol/gamma-HCH transport system substrate-binding protein
MYASRTTRLLVGTFIILGMVAVAYLSFRLVRMELLSPPGYTIHADFEDISGLKIGDLVEIAGVPVGKVTAISLRDDHADVSMHLNKGVEVDSDAIAAIKTNGIIGDKYVSIAPGAGDRMLKNGDSLRYTQSSFVLEDAIAQLIGGKL